MGKIEYFLFNKHLKLFCMESSDIMKTLTLPTGERVNYKEVSVPNTTYSKVVLEDGHVAIIIHPVFGGGWSTGYHAYDHNQQFIFDSRIVLYLLSDEYKKLFTQNTRISDAAIKAYAELTRSIFPHMENFDPDCGVRTFTQLVVSFIPEHTRFRIKEYDGAESIEILDLNTYMYA